jgi:hypothetical protein
VCQLREQHINSCSQVIHSASSLNKIKHFFTFSAPKSAAQP